MPNNIGTAYAFFHCSVNRDQVSAALADIREVVKTPSLLELALYEGFEQLKSDDLQLTEILEEAQRSEMRYALRSSLAHASNGEVADETAAILNQAYQSPLYADGEAYNGVIVYKEGDAYVFRD